VLTADDIMEHLLLDGARWERSASLAVVGGIGRHLSDIAVSAIAEGVLDAADQESESLIAPQPALRAREAVGALAFAAPPVFRDRLMTMLRAEAGGTYVGTARPAAEALILLTNAGLSDETEVLAELFLADAGLTGISPVWLGGQLPEHAAAAERVAVAAREGSIMALEVAATAGLPGEDTELATRCADHALAAVERPSVTETRQPDGTITRSVGLGGGWEMTAVCARYAPVSVRQRLASRLVDDASDLTLPLMNRYSAANGLFNIARSLPKDMASDLAARIAPVALHDAVPSDWDPSPERAADPFERFRIGGLAADVVRAAAIQALASLVRVAGAGNERLHSAVAEALLHPAVEVVAAGWSALAVDDQLPVPEWLPMACASEHAEVRSAALRCWQARRDDVPTGILAARLAADTELSVRLTLLGLAADRGVAGMNLLEKLLDDRDSYVRAFARHRLHNGRG